VGYCVLGDGGECGASRCEYVEVCNSSQMVRRGYVREPRERRAVEIRPRTIETSS
jgi:hypothetical protein